MNQWGQRGQDRRFARPFQKLGQTQKGAQQRRVQFVHMGAGQWWTVPLAVLVAIPLYSNVTDIVPVMQSLLVKGMPLGTTMAFCMSSVAASLPEVLMLRQIMNVKLQAAFIGYLWAIFTLAGWLFNLLGPYIR